MSPLRQTNVGQHPVRQYAPRPVQPPIAAYKKNCLLSADQSAAILTAKIEAKEPFFFIRYGDGALECIVGKKGMTRDLEHYSEDLGQELWISFRLLMDGTHADSLVYVGDWLSASFDATSIYARYEQHYAELIGDGKPTFLHFESLLLMRESQALLDFYRTVKADTRRKLYMGPAANAAAAKMLGAEHLVTPMTGLFDECPRLTHELFSRDFDVLLYGAGMAGNIPAICCWEEFPERTYVNLGSALDPLFMGRKTRMQQILPLKARIFFRSLL